MMNFSLRDTKKQRSKTNASKKKATNLAFGLNTRKEKNNKSSSVLNDGISSSDEGDNDRRVGHDNGTISSKGKVNRELLAEQDALRKRADKAIVGMSEKSNIYDYDTNYESFSSGHQSTLKTHEEHNFEKKRESRYIANLMENAKERKEEREIVMERQIAREQEAEGINDEFLGKDKFITKGYKRVLDERKTWLERDAKQSKIEEEEDVTKKTGVGVSAIYSNFDNFVSGKKGNNDNRLDGNKSNHPSYDKEKCGDAHNRQFNRKKRHNDIDDDHDDDTSAEAIDEEVNEQAAKANRIQKIFNARDRYLERTGISAG
jgi:hypothetical protein